MTQKYGRNAKCGFRHFATVTFILRENFLRCFLSREVAQSALCDLRMCEGGWGGREWEWVLCLLVRL